jgi:hypothetical protein
MPRKRPRLPEDQDTWLTLVDQLVNGADDRSAVVLGGCIVEAVLDELVASWLLPDAPLGFTPTVYAKIDVAFAMALIGDEEKAVLQAIANLRNVFAHNLHDADFKHPRARQSLAAFRTMDRAAKGDSPRDLFRKAITAAVSLRLKTRDPVTQDEFRAEVEARLDREFAAFVRKREARKRSQE